MDTAFPAGLDKKFRAYRFAYWSVAVAETICLAALLLALWTPAALFLVAGWLAWKCYRRPSLRTVAGLVEARYPELGETLTAAVELVISPDTSAVKGSPELIRQLLSQADRLAAPLDFSRLVPLRTVAVLIAVTVVVNLSLSHQREQARRRISGATTSTAAAPEDLMARLQKMAGQLRELPPGVLRALPSHVRSLDEAVNMAGRANLTGNAGDIRALREAVAELLAEFARLAGDIPDLAELSRQADVLAKEFATSVETLRVRGEGMSPVTTVEVTGWGGEKATPRGTLPVRAPEGPAWSVPGLRSGVDAGWRNYPSEYEQAIWSYFERIAGH
jgi:hypothetical protein